MLAVSRFGRRVFRVSELDEPLAPSPPRRLGPSLAVGLSRHWRISRTHWVDQLGCGLLSTRPDLSRACGYRLLRARSVLDGGRRRLFDGPAFHRSCGQSALLFDRGGLTVFRGRGSPRRAVLDQHNPNGLRYPECRRLLVGSHRYVGGVSCPSSTPSFWLAGAGLALAASPAAKCIRITPKSGIKSMTSRQRSS